MGTIGGALANNDPAADYPAAVLGLNATVNTNKRKIAADDFFKGLYETALAEGEIITSVSFPIPKKAAYAKFPQPASRFALVGVFVAQTGKRRARRRDRRGAVGVPREGDRGCAREERSPRMRRRAVKMPRDGAQQRHARIGGVSRAPRGGARVAGGSGGGVAYAREQRATPSLPYPSGT